MIIIMIRPNHAILQNIIKIYLGKVAKFTQSLSSTVGIFTGLSPGLMCAGLAGTWGLFTATVGNGGGGSASRVRVELFPFLLGPPLEAGAVAEAPTSSVVGALAAKTCGEK